MSEEANTPTIEDVLEWIRNYQHNKRLAADLNKQYQNMIGKKLVAQYGVESVMPKAQGGGQSDPTGQEVVNKEQQIADLDMVEKQYRFIEHRWHRIDQENTALAFHLVAIEERSTKETALIMQKSQRFVQKKLREAARDILEGQTKKDGLYWGDYGRK